MTRLDDNVKVTKRIACFTIPQEYDLAKLMKAITEEGKSKISGVVLSREEFPTRPGETHVHGFISYSGTVTFMPSKVKEKLGLPPATHFSTGFDLRKWLEYILKKIKWLMEQGTLPKTWEHIARKLDDEVRVGNLAVYGEGQNKINELVDKWINVPEKSTKTEAAMNCIRDFGMAQALEKYPSVLAAHYTFFKDYNEQVTKERKKEEEQLSKVPPIFIDWKRDKQAYPMYSVDWQLVQVNNALYKTFGDTGVVRSRLERKRHFCFFGPGGTGKSREAFIYAQFYRAFVYKTGVDGWQDHLYHNDYQIGIFDEFDPEQIKLPLLLQLLDGQLHIKQKYQKALEIEKPMIWIFTTNVNPQLWYANQNVDMEQRKALLGRFQALIEFKESEQVKIHNDLWDEHHLHVGRTDENNFFVVDY